MNPYVFQAGGPGRPPEVRLNGADPDSAGKSAQQHSSNPASAAAAPDSSLSDKKPAQDQDRNHDANNQQSYAALAPEDANNVPHDAAFRIWPCWANSRQPQTRPCLCSVLDSGISGTKSDTIAPAKSTCLPTCHCSRLFSLCHLELPPDALRPHPQDLHTVLCDNRRGPPLGP